MLTPKQKILIAVFALGVFVLIVDLVRRRKLGEEFSWIWLLGGTALIVFAAIERAFDVIRHITGIVEPTSIAFFFGIAFLLLVSLHISVKLSTNRTDIKNLAQQVTLQQHEIEELTLRIEATSHKSLAPESSTSKSGDGE